MKRTFSFSIFFQKIAILWKYAITCCRMKDKLRNPRILMLRYLLCQTKSFFLNLCIIVANIHTFTPFLQCSRKSSQQETFLNFIQNNPLCYPYFNRMGQCEGFRHRKCEILWLTFRTLLLSSKQTKWYI